MLSPSEKTNSRVPSNRQTCVQVLRSIVSTAFNTGASTSRRTESPTQASTGDTSTFFVFPSALIFFFLIIIIIIIFFYWGARLRAGEGIRWLAAGTMPNSLYRMPLAYLSLTCVFCYSCSFLFVVCVFVFFFALIGAW